MLIRLNFVLRLFGFVGVNLKETNVLKILFGFGMNEIRNRSRREHGKCTVLRGKLIY
jgi:hypothetical protein